MPDRHFHSGTSQIARLRGLSLLGEPIGTTVSELSEAMREWLLDTGAQRHCSLFVDSGAYAEMGTGIEPDWKDVLGFGLQVAKAYGSNAYLVAPDKVADPRESLVRFRRHSAGVKRWLEHGARVLIPVQVGADPVLYMREAAQALGVSVRTLTPAFPMSKNAWAPDAVVRSIRKLKPFQVHLLGRGPKQAGTLDLITQIREASPGIFVSTDSCTWSAIMGKGRSHERGLARVQEAPTITAQRWLDMSPGEDLLEDLDARLNAKRRRDLLWMIREDQALWLKSPDAWVSAHGAHDWLVQALEETAPPLDPETRMVLGVMQTLSGAHERDEEFWLKGALDRGQFVVKDNGSPISLDALRELTAPILSKKRFRLGALERKFREEIIALGQETIRLKAWLDRVQKLRS